MKDIFFQLLEYIFISISYPDIESNDYKKLFGLSRLFVLCEAKFVVLVMSFWLLR